MDIRREVNVRLDSVIDSLSQDLVAFQLAAQRHEIQHTAFGAAIGMLIGTVGGVLGMVVTGVLGAVVGKDWTPASTMEWYGLRPSLELPIPETLTADEKRIVENNQAAIYAFEAVFNAATLRSRESEKLLELFEALDVHHL